ncbi:MAG TPA: efflux RND transporter periplasmic adaptor subunit [Casimicrobiaceae bacterium]|nr:efflux RND transporter periplasmic adaptor subunit [Casimicrobiaceae bacterium]
MISIYTKPQAVRARRAFLTAVSAALLLGACSKAQPPSAPQAPQVSVVTVHKTSVPVTIEVPGRTNPFLVAQVRARVDGVVLKRDYKEGGDVKAGQRLYQIDPAPFVAALDSAKASLQKAQANVVALSAQAERFKTLVAGNAVSKQDYDNAVSSQGQAEADVASGKAAVNTAQINLGYTAVVASISGRASISQVTEGAYVQQSAATLMTTIQQIDPMYVDVTQSSVQGLQFRREVAAGQLKLNGPNKVQAKLQLEDGSEYSETGTLQATDVTVDQNTGTVTLRTIFPNPNAVLLPGMFVRARIEAGVTENAFLVPQAGVAHDAKGQATAMVVGADNKVAVRTLQLAGTHGDRWVVNGGLAEGDRVLVAGLQKVQPGATVIATEAPLTPAAPSAASASTPGASAQAKASATNNAKPASGVVADVKPAPQRLVSAQTK